MSEAIESDPLAYPCFNAFFTRALKPGARAAPADPNAIACPADGRISQIGRIQDGHIVQAKGRDYSVSELLGSEKTAASYRDGSFATVYLSPRDYHRVHAPLSGTLRETLHIPGRIFSVAPATVEDVPRLFARNERLVCHFDGEHGPFAVVLVGAMLVSGIETVWSGVEVPPYARDIQRKCWIERPIRLQRFDELGASVASEREFLDAITVSGLNLRFGHSPIHQSPAMDGFGSAGRGGYRDEQQQLRPQVGC